MKQSNKKEKLRRHKTIQGERPKEAKKKIIVARPFHFNGNEWYAPIGWSLQS